MPQLPPLFRGRPPRKRKPVSPWPSVLVGAAAIGLLAAAIVFLLALAL